MTNLSPHHLRPPCQLQQANKPRRVVQPRDALCNHPAQHRGVQAALPTRRPTHSPPTPRATMRIPHSLSVPFLPSLLSLLLLLLLAPPALSSTLPPVCASHTEMMRTAGTLRERILSTGLGASVAECFDAKLPGIWASPLFSIDVVVSGAAVSEPCFDRKVMAAAIGNGFAECLSGANGVGSAEQTARLVLSGTEAASVSEAATSATEAATSARASVVPQRWRCRGGHHACCELHLLWIKGAIENCFAKMCTCGGCGFCQDAPIFR